MFSFHKTPYWLYAIEFYYAVVKEKAVCSGFCFVTTIVVNSA